MSGNKCRPNKIINENHASQKNGQNTVRTRQKDVKCQEIPLCKTSGSTKDNQSTKGWQKMCQTSDTKQSQKQKISLNKHSPNTDKLVRKIELKGK